MPPPASWRPIDSRFVHLEARITQHRRWLEIETRNDVQAFADVEKQRAQYVTFLQQQDEVKPLGSNNEEQYRIAKRQRRLEKIAIWVSKTSYSEIGRNHVEGQRHRVINEQFLRTEKYRNWKHDSFEKVIANDSENLRHSWPDRILFVQGMGMRPASFIFAEKLTNCSGRWLRQECSGRNNHGRLKI